MSEECLRETIVSMAKDQRKGPEIIKKMTKFEALRERKREEILSVWGRRESILKCSSCRMNVFPIII